MSTRPSDVPAPTAVRLSLYLRQLEQFARSGLQTVNSTQLAAPINVKPDQVRKDLAHFGQFGRPGKGYEVAALIRRLRSILGTDRTWQVALAGAGHLGTALLAYRGFGRKGFQMVAVFDTDPSKVGRPAPGHQDLVVEHIDRIASVVRQRRVDLGIIAVPADAAQPVADAMVAAGVRGLLNFAPTGLQVPDTVAVNSVDLSVQLEQLSFRIGGGPGGPVAVELPTAQPVRRGRKAPTRS